MPIDYRKYPPNWSAIRQRILERANHKCEWCKVEKPPAYFCEVNVEEGMFYQDEDGWIYDASNSKQIGGNYLGSVDPKGKKHHDEDSAYNSPT